MFNRGINETQNTPQKIARDEILSAIYTELCTCRAQLNRIEDQNTLLLLELQGVTRATNRGTQATQPEPPRQAEQVEPAEQAKPEPPRQAEPIEPPRQAEQVEPTEQARQAEQVKPLITACVIEPPRQAEEPAKPSVAVIELEKPSVAANTDQDFAMLEQLTAQPLQTTVSVKPKRRITKKKTSS